MSLRVSIAVCPAGIPNGDKSMKSFPKFEFRALYEQAYDNGYSRHGDLGLKYEKYASHLKTIIEKHSGANLPVRSALDFFQKLHKNDLYVSVACAQPSDRAWDYFSASYGRYIKYVARLASSISTASDEMAESILGHIFLPDATGRSRIASYDGRSSLATWLSAIINNRAMKERERKCNNLERLNDLPEIADRAAIGKIDAEIRANKYGALIKESFIKASKSLSERERLMVVMRYEEGLQGTEIASILGLHPSTVTRQLQQAYEKLRAQVVSILASKCGPNSPALHECLIDIMENPNHCILTSIKSVH